MFIVGIRREDRFFHSKNVGKKEKILNGKSMNENWLIGWMEVRFEQMAHLKNLHPRHIQNTYYTRQTITPIRQKPWMKSWVHLSQLAPLQTNEWEPFEQCTNNAFDRVRFIVWKPYCLSVFLLPKMFNTISHFDSRTVDRQTNFRNFIIIWRNAAWYYLPHNGRSYLSGIFFSLFHLNGNGNEKKMWRNKMKHWKVPSSKEIDNRRLINFDHLR